MARSRPTSLVDQIFSSSPKVTPSPLAAAPKPMASKAAPAEPMPQAFEPEPLPPPKKADPLPRPGDAYRANAQFINRLGSGERMIDFVDRECFSEAFSYADLRRVSWRKSPTPGGGPQLVLRFVAAGVVEVVISGRNLDDIRHYVREGMMPWVWEQPDNFRPKSDQMTVITGIEIKEFEI